MDRIYSVEKLRGSYHGTGLSRWKNFTPIDFAPFIEYSKMVALFVTKEDTIKSYPLCPIRLSTFQIPR